MTQNDTRTSFSIRLVDLLRQRGRTLKQIAEILELSESFMSRVSRGERSLTLEHLTRLEDELGEPLPLLLLEASRGEVSESSLPMFEEAIGILRRSAMFRRGRIGSVPRIADRLVRAACGCSDSLRELRAQVREYVEQIVQDHVRGYDIDPVPIAARVNELIDVRVVRERETLAIRSEFVNQHGQREARYEDALASGATKHPTAQGLQMTIRGIVAKIAERAIRAQTKNGSAQGDPSGA